MKGYTPTAQEIIDAACGDDKVSLDEFFRWLGVVLLRAKTEARLEDARYQLKKRHAIRKED